MTARYMDSAQREATRTTEPQRERFAPCREPFRTRCTRLGPGTQEWISVHQTGDVISIGVKRDGWTRGYLTGTAVTLVVGTD